MSKLYYKNGEIQKVNCGNGTEMIFAKGSSTDDFLAYCAELSANGYAKVMQREIAENIFAAFKGEEEYIYAYYTAYSGAVRTVHGPLSSYGDEDCGVLEEICTPELCAVGQPDFMNCGQGYIYRLADGRFLVHDGGCKYDCRPDFMYDAIKELATDKNNIVIAAWFISHPHGDHQDAFEEFIENHGGDINVRIERVIFNFADADMYTYMRKDNQFEDCKGLVDRIYTKCETYIPEAQLIKAHTGQIFRFGGCKVEVLYTVEDVLPVDCFDYVNGTSIVIRVTVDGQSAMLLADTTHTSGRILENMFGDFLKSDMVQLAHHGMWASYPSLYKHVAASIVLWPNVERFAKDWLADKPIATAIGLADDVYISGSGNTVLSLPHTVEGNKAAVIEMLKSL